MCMSAASHTRTVRYPADSRTVIVLLFIFSKHINTVNNVHYQPAHLFTDFVTGMTGSVKVQKLLEHANKMISLPTQLENL